MVNIKKPLSGKTLILIGAALFIVGKLLSFLSVYRILSLGIISGLLGDLMAVMGVMFFIIGLITLISHFLKKKKDKND